MYYKMFFFNYAAKSSQILWFIANFSQNCIKKFSSAIKFVAKYDKNINLLKSTMIFNIY